MKYIFLLSMLLLSACASTPVVDSVVQKNVPIVAPSIDPIVTQPVNWQVLTAAQMQALIKTNPKIVIFGLDAQGYRNLSLNLNDIQRYINDEKAVIMLYKNVDAQRSAVTGTTSTK